MSSGASSARLKKAKREIRKRVRAERDALPEARRRDLGSQAVARLLGLSEVRSAATVMSFWSFGSEVPTGRLNTAMHERGVRVALPRIVAGDLVPYVFVPGDATTGTSFGAREPLATAERVDPVEIELVVTPAVAFDRAGHRIGYGGGYYDRFFRGAPRSLRVGLAFDLQVLDDELPAGHADVRVHAVVTERAVTRCLEASG